MKKNLIFILIIILYLNFSISTINAEYIEGAKGFKYDNYSIPKYSGNVCLAINNNIPKFSYLDIIKKVFEKYSDLDYLNRSNTAFAKIDYSLMPTKKSKKINSIMPSGWNQASYSIIPGNWLYNRTHLIGYQLTGEDLNSKNIITGTYYLNHEGMLKFENTIANYLKKSKKNKVLYRVTPVFLNSNLLATGVIMEGLSLDFSSIIFNVFCYNVQPGISIDYSNGKNMLTPIITKKKVKILDLISYKHSINIKCHNIKNVKYQYAYKEKISDNYKYINSSSSSKKIKNLKENTYYDIKARIFIKSNDTYFYSLWSNIKRIKTS